MVKRTGWSSDKAEKELIHAWEEYGVSPYNYLIYSCDKFTDTEISEFAELLKGLYKKSKEWINFYINVVCEKTGWEKDFAVIQMNKAKSKGYTYRQFITKALYVLSPEEIDNLEPLKKNNSNNVPTINSKNVQRREAIMQKTGWTFGRLQIEYIKSKIIAGSNFHDYYMYKLYEYPVEESLKYITEEVHLKLQLRYCNYAGDFRYFDDKMLFCETFKNFIGRKYFESKGLTLEEFNERVKGWKDIIVKEKRGLGGHGVTRYSVNNNADNNMQIYDIIKQGDYIIEEKIQQHPDIAKFEPNTVNTIRVMSMNIDGECRILNAVMKFGSGAAVDNVIEGNGCVAGIDLETGIICTDGINRDGEVQRYHTNSHKQFRGFQVPCWDKLIETVKAASKVIPDMPYIGWDIAVKSNNEIAIIEGNHNQAGFLVQYPFAISEGQGRRFTVEKYLTF